MLVRIEYWRRNSWTRPGTQDKDLDKHEEDISTLDQDASLIFIGVVVECMTCNVRNINDNFIMIILRSMATILTMLYSRMCESVLAGPVRCGSSRSSDTWELVTGMYTLIDIQTNDRSIEIILIIFIHKHFYLKKKGILNRF